MKINLFLEILQKRLEIIRRIIYNMDLNIFVKKFAELFDETDESEFKADTEFRKLVDWSSMVGLAVIAMIDEEYGITVNIDSFIKSKTIEELFNVVKESNFNGKNI